ncbi:hypothetical protein LUX05_16270 [Streptomyces somaliensis]|nr:hypothetical protein [Streptomyces somaliensis]
MRTTPRSTCGRSPPPRRRRAPQRGQAPPEGLAESTRFLGTGFGAQQYPQSRPQDPQAYPPQHPQAYPPPQGPPLHHAQSYPQPPHPGHPQPDPDAEATQYLPPVPGNGGPPAEFDSLFRDDAAGATQRMPRVEPSAPRPARGHRPHRPQGLRLPPPYAEQHGHDGHGHRDGHDHRDESGRRGGSGRRHPSKLPLVAAVVVGCAVVGLGAGALMGGGEEAPDADGKAGVTAASSPAPVRTSDSAPPPDPARGQAEELDKLLADSNDSRDAVIRSVENIKRCRDLDRAATDLRAAAGQRRELVNRLGRIEIDRLPDHAELTSSLTRAWQASATADDHYAAWARQVKEPKNCKGGRARNTASTARAAVASGEATGAKREAARLWNGIAETYGLTRRQPTQL